MRRTSPRVFDSIVNVSPIVRDVAGPILETRPCANAAVEMRVTAIAAKAAIQRPVNFGFRFSRNADAPSCLSSEL